MRLRVAVDGVPFAVTFEPGGPGGELRVTIDDEEIRVSRPRGGDPLEWIVVDGRPHEIALDAELRSARSRSGAHRLEIHDLHAGPARAASRDGRVKAPIPGRVTRLCVAPGDPVGAGQTLLVLEAMKMENPIGAPIAGVVRALNARAGQNVALNEVLAEVSP